MSNFMVAYGYDRESGEYTGPVNAWEDQLTPGDYLLPLNSTFEAPPNQEDGKIRKWNGTSWELIDVLVPDNDELAFWARSRRNTLLYECDWTQLPDVKKVNESWIFYRQQLRDITLQEGFPAVINWPTKPN